jgi:hypothetical protein
MSEVRTWEEGLDLTEAEVDRIVDGVVGEGLTEEGIEHVLEAAQTAKRMHHLFGEILSGQMVVEVATTPNGFFMHFMGLKNRRIQ